jgi:hypothetical protein
MKHLFKTLIVPAVCFAIIACTQSTEIPLSPVPSPTATLAPTVTPNPTLTATIEPTPKPEYVPPTLVPTIDPNLVPELLSGAFSVQALEGINGYQIRQITGWDYGFGGDMWQYSCSGYYWLDINHILLYPKAGQQVEFYGDGASRASNIVPQPVVMNVDNGAIWLPPVPSRTCQHVYWSPELEILITSEMHNGISTVSTYTKDGYRLASYPGRLLDISPRGTKILISENTLIDLRTNKTIRLAWSLDDYYEPILSDLYWTYPDETRVYRCCYFYADLSTGISHRFARSDFRDTNGNYLDPSGLWFHQGEWVLDNTYFLVSWLAVDDGPVRYLPMFDPATKLFYDVWEMAGIPTDWTWLYNDVSPDGNYVWIAGWNESYLVDLITFESLHYLYHEHPYTFPDTDWSADSKFVWFQIQDSDSKSTDFQIVSVADKKSSPLPIIPRVDSYHEWHPIEPVAVYPSADEDMLIFLDVTTMSFHELPFTLQKQTYDNAHFAWNPKGEKLALVAEDGSVWQVEYPDLENLEQLTSSLPDISDLKWLPDGNSISFISGSDIYIVKVK